MSERDKDPFAIGPSPWGQELCRRLSVVEHPAIRQLVARDDHDAGGLGIVLLEELARDLLHMMVQSPEGAEDRTIGQVLEILYGWLDADNPWMVNDFAVGFLECLEYKDAAGARLLQRLRPDVRNLLPPEDFPWAYASMTAFEAAYRKAYPEAD